MEEEGQAKVMIGTRNCGASVPISGDGSGVKSDGSNPASTNTNRKWKQGTE